MKNEQYTAMYAEYQKGFSLAEVGKMFGVTRQSVYEGFRCRGYEMRQKKELPFLTFNGIKFTISKSTGYYRRTDGEREQMHIYVWRFYNGDIPPDHDIHHKNHIKTDNRIENLELKTKTDHTRDHLLQPVKIRQCPVCDKDIPRHEHEGPTAYNRRSFCGYPCSRKWMKGKPKGTKIQCAI